MKQLVFRSSLAVAIMVVLLSVFGASAAHASPRAGIQPAYIECSSTYQYQQKDYVWTDTGNASSYNQRLDVKFFSLRDSNTGVFCNQMHAYTMLTYKRVGSSSTIKVHMCPKNSGYCYNNSASVPANTSYSYWQYITDTGWQSVSGCWDAFGVWDVPYTLTVNLPGLNAQGQPIQDWVCP